LVPRTYEMPLKIYRIISHSIKNMEVYFNNTAEIVFILWSDEA